MTPEEMEQAEREYEAFLRDLYLSLKKSNDEYEASRFNDHFSYTNNPPPLLRPRN